MSTTTRPATSHIAPFGLRMQPSLRAQLEKAANANGRSLNAEIIARLEQSLPDSEAGLQVEISELKKRFEELAISVERALTVKN